MKRYNFYREIDGSSIEEDPYGEWVKWEDVAEKDALIKSLTERVRKYMTKYPNGANGCACLFDDNENLIQGKGCRNQTALQVSQRWARFRDILERIADEVEEDGIASIAEKALEAK